MKNYRRNLPSLDGLVFFEAAARHCGFTASAKELCVTQAAVSKRIKELETRLGTDLFLRQGRKLSLTGSGQRLYERCAMALEYLEDAVAREMGDQADKVQIAANSAVSAFWLAPRLTDFRVSDEEGAVRLLTSDRLGDLLDGQNDLAITYGYGDFPGWHSTLLFPERLVPVARPDYFQTLGLEAPRTFADLAGLPEITLLDYERLAPDWVNWKVWIDRLGAQDLKGLPVRTCSSYASAIGDALSGKGIGLGSLTLIDRDLEGGRLCRFGDEVLQTGRGYYLSTPVHRELSVLSEKLRNALLVHSAGAHPISGGITA